jgi:hypothetical protein
MNASIVVTLITSGAGLAVAIVSVPVNYLLSQRTRREQTQDLMARYRDPRTRDTNVEILHYVETLPFLRVFYFRGMRSFHVIRSRKAPTRPPIAAPLP